MDERKPEADETVYICSEGRPWRKDESGDFKRVDARGIPSAPDPRYPELWRRVVGRSVKRKPYDDKNGF